MDTLSFLLFLTEFLSLLLSSSSTDYHINCGSTSTCTLPYSRIFDADSPSLSAGKSKTITNSSALPANTSPLYQTARIFTKKSHYVLPNITDNSTYLVRLHFFAFISKGTNLSDASFNVSTTKFMLFSGRIDNLNVPEVKEFFLSDISSGKLRIYFIPSNDNSFAFVNAIEVILLPKRFIADDSLAVPPLGTADGKYYGLLSNGLQTIYRVNIGGPKIDDSGDPLWRNWVRDDQFLNTVSSSEISTSFELRLVNEAIPDTAPDLVFKTCRHMSTNISNITWSFQVKKKNLYFVRLHFCDIISESNGILKFGFYFYTNFRKVVDSVANNIDPFTPYFYDIVVDSDESGYMNISIGPESGSQKKDAYLNGLEIMEFVTNTTSDLDEHTDKSPSHKKKLVVGFLVGGSVLISLLILSFLVVTKRKKAKPAKPLVVKGKPHPHSWISATTDSTSSPLPNLNLKLKIPLTEILAATSNFNNKLVIGEGGFGKVYKATLSNGIQVAVKRSDSSHGQGLPEFQTEVTILSSIRHRHLVSLIGYCDEGSEMILVYEFMEKGTLRDHLYSWKENTKNESTKPKLTWKQRLEICIGAATGLHYLHTGSDWVIIHRDVKSTNILLDENYVAKVADFGLSQSGPSDPDYPDMVVGSFGYLDPEYMRTLQLTYKSDVYSFGVVLLEVLCGRPPIIDSAQKEERHLAEWGMLWQKKGQLEKIIDPSLAGEINPNSLRKFGEIAEKCLKKKGGERPTMLDVRWDLEYAMQLQQSAVQRESYEDSSTDISSNYIFPSSCATFPDEECAQIGGDDDLNLDSRIVFN